MLAVFYIVLFPRLPNKLYWYNQFTHCLSMILKCWKPKNELRRLGDKPFCAFFFIIYIYIKYIQFNEIYRFYWNQCLSFFFFLCRPSLSLFCFFLLGLWNPICLSGIFDLNHLTYWNLSSYCLFEMMYAIMYDERLQSPGDRRYAFYLHLFSHGVNCFFPALIVYIS